VLRTRAPQSDFTIVADFQPATASAPAKNTTTYDEDALTDDMLVAENVPKWSGISVSAVEWLIRERQVLSIVAPGRMGLV
jgi:hypothetical protein